MYRRLTTTVVALLCALAFPFPGDSQWKRVEVDGVSVCQDASGVTFRPPYDGKSQVTVVCNGLTSFLPWLIGSAEAQMVLGVAAGPPQSAPPGQNSPPSSSFTATNLGNSTTAACDDVSSTELDVTGDGVDIIIDTSGNQNSGFCQKTFSSGSIQIIGRLSEFDEMEYTEEFTSAGPYLADDLDVGHAGGGIFYPFGAVAGSTGIYVKWRGSDGGTISGLATPRAGVPLCLGMTWNHTTSEAQWYTSDDASCTPDPDLWTLIRGPDTLNLTHPVNAGFQINSQVMGSASKVSFTHVSIGQDLTLESDPPPPPPDPSGEHLYPRYGCICQGGRQQYDEPGQADWLGKYKLITLSGDWEDWGNHNNRDTVHGAIKAASALYGSDILIYQYGIYNEVTQTGSTPPGAYNASQDGRPGYGSAIDAINGWLYASGDSGTKTGSTFRANFPLVNVSTYAPTDAQGKRPEQMAARYLYDFMIADIPNYGALNSVCNATCRAAQRSSHIDGFFRDALLCKPRTSGSADWNRDGSADSAENATIQAAFRAGEKEFFDELVAIGWTGYYGGNSDMFQCSDISPFTTLGNMGLFEGWAGQSWSPLTWTTGTNSLQFLLTEIARLHEPRHYGVNIGLPVGTLSSDQYRIFRHTHAIAQIIGAYTMVSDGDGAGDIWHDGDLEWLRWLDEYDGGSGIADPNWCGAPVDPPVTSVSQTYQQSGVYKREFENCVVLARLKGSDFSNVLTAAGSSVNVTLPYDTRRITGISGQSDLAVNTGATISSGANIALFQADGLVLEKL